jgi:hypothetical protein
VTPCQCQAFVQSPANRPAPAGTVAGAEMMAVATAMHLQGPLMAACMTCEHPKGNHEDPDNGGRCLVEGCECQGYVAPVVTKPEPQPVLPQCANPACGHGSEQHLEGAGACLVSHCACTAFHELVDNGDPAELAAVPAGEPAPATADPAPAAAPKRRRRRKGGSY